jgi:hypothetical protein
MSSKFVRDEIKAFLDANWTDTPIVGEENEFDSPPDNLDPWLTYGFLAEPENPVSIGAPSSNCKEEYGQIHITVFVASGSGSDAALTYAESVRTMMRTANLGSGLRVVAVDAPETAFPSRVDASQGNFFGYQVVVNYHYQYSA